MLQGYITGSGECSLNTMQKAWVCLPFHQGLLGENGTCVWHIPSAVWRANHANHCAALQGSPRAASAAASGPIYRPGRSMNMGSLRSMSPVSTHSSEETMPLLDIRMNNRVQQHRRCAAKCGQAMRCCWRVGGYVCAEINGAMVLLGASC